MPELPEVETVRIFLKEHILRKKTLSIKIENSKLRFRISAEIPEKFHNKIITKILRRGKYLIFLYSGENVLLFHLGMTGYFRISETYSKRKHDHLLFNFDKKVLVFNDIRKFGFVKNYKKNEIFFCKHLKNLGPEPLSKEFSVSYFKDNLYRRTTIKDLLMNQDFVSGLGNIYCSEILFHSRVNPRRVVSTLREKEIIKIIEFTREVLNLAIKLGGTTITNFIVSDEKIGYFKNNLKVYGREKMPCIRCKKNNIIQKIKQSGRSTFFCHKCQL